jgi:ferredoxin-NADP reductase
MNQMFTIDRATNNGTAVSLTLRVTARRVVGEDIEEFTFAAADGAQLPDWQPGAHVEFKLPLAKGIESRSYSLLGDPADRSQYRIAVLRQDQGQGGSVWMHDKAFVGKVVTAVGPRNAFVFEPARQYLFVAGGIGITPLLPMIAQAEREDTPWQLVYLVRQESRFAYARELRQYPASKLQMHASMEPTFDLKAALDNLPDGTAVQACGPVPLLNALEKFAAAADGRWTLSVERFAAPVLGAGEGSFEIALARSNKVLQVAADKSILEVLRAEGIAVESSCRSGTCGTCECGVLEGAIDHRDQVLTAGERADGKSMMVCVSRAAGNRLVLDI